MAISLTHTTVVVVPDDGASPVGSDEWNAEHSLTLAEGRLLGRLGPGDGQVQEVLIESITADLDTAVAALDDAKVNRVGDTMTGGLNISSGNLDVSTGNATIMGLMSAVTGQINGNLNVGGNIGVTNDLNVGNAVTANGEIRGVTKVAVNAFNASNNPAFALQSESGTNAGGLYWDRVANEVRVTHSGGGLISVGAAAITLASATTVQSALTVAQTITANNQISGITKIAVNAVDAAENPAFALQNQVGVLAGGLYWQRIGNEIVMSHQGGTLWRIGLWGVASNHADAYKPGGGPWTDTSDVRTKNILGAYDHGLTELLQVSPVRYTYKNNHSAGEGPTSKGLPTDQEFVGVIAQDIETVMPETVKQTSGTIDGQPVTDLRIYDSNAVIYALLNAVKELAARVQALEAAR